MPCTILGTKNTKVKKRKCPCLCRIYSLTENKYTIHGPISDHSGQRSQSYICKTDMEMYQENVILLKVSPDILLL